MQPTNKDVRRDATPVECSGDFRHGLPGAVVRLTVMSGDDFVRAVSRIGFALDRMEGSHMVLIGPAGRRLTVPRHRELGRGLLRALVRDAGLTREAFLDLLHGRSRR